MHPRVLIGLIGSNIQKSLSPALHEDACAAYGIVGHYHLMDLNVLPGRTLERVLAGAQAVGFSGVNVTFPCKEAVLPLLGGLDPEARQIGAVNTVTIDCAGETRGHNTDRTGFRRAFEEELGTDAALGKCVLLVGAGGAGRAVAFALFDLGIDLLLIHDQNMDRAHRLAAELGEHFGKGRSRAVEDTIAGLAQAAGAVNATPVGMLGMPGLPVPLQAIGRHHWIADVIYTPLETRLIEEARAKGCRVMGGGGMCVHQAAESFRLFAGLEPDIARMRRRFAQAARLRS